MVLCKVAINLNVLSVFMKNWIDNNLDGTLIITCRGLEEEQSTTPLSCNSFRNQIISAVVLATTRYSSSALDLDTTSCFLKCHEIRESQRDT